MDNLVRVGMRVVCGRYVVETGLAAVSFRRGVLRRGVWRAAGRMQIVSHASDMRAHSTKVPSHPLPAPIPRSGGCGAVVNALQVGTLPFSVVARSALSREDQAQKPRWNFRQA